MRINSGINGLDDVLEGGLPFPSTILVAGDTGSGKTTFGLQFLVEGAKNDEKGLFFTTISEPVSWMLRFASRWTFMEQSYIDNQIKYVELAPVLRKAKHYDEVLEYIDAMINEVMPKRIVLDPVSAIKNIFPEDYRMFLMDLSIKLKNWQTVTLLTGEFDNNDKYPLDVAYTTDGVIILYNRRELMGRQRSLEVLKMRGTNHVSGDSPMDVTYDGITIYPKES